MNSFRSSIASFARCASRDHRGCFGKSSGGYGAIIHGMKYAQYWGAIADHSGDAYFDFVYWHDWPNTLNELSQASGCPSGAPGATTRSPPAARKGLAEGLDDGRVKRFLDNVWGKEKLSCRGGALHHEPVHGGDATTPTRKRRWAFACRSISRPAN